jgi:hypothetical protein
MDNYMANLRGSTLPYLGPISIRLVNSLPVNFSILVSKQID